MPLPEILQKNNSEAMFRIAERHYYGQDDVSIDRARAFKWYCKAAELGHAEAQFVLALMYEHGRGIDQSAHKALGWYKRASNLGHAGAMNNLGCMFYEGRGVSRNFDKAAEFFLSSAKLGHPAAQFNIAIMYQFGKGLQQNDALAFQWCSKSAEQGDISACYRLSWLYEHAVGTERNSSLARFWFLKAQSCDQYALNENIFQLESMADLSDIAGECLGNITDKKTEAEHSIDWYRTAWSRQFRSARNVEVCGGMLTNDYCKDCRFCCGPQPEEDGPFPMALLDRQISDQTKNDFYLINEYTASLDKHGCRALGPHGCRLQRELRPVACNIFPFVLINRRLYLYKICPATMFIPKNKMHELAEKVRLWLDVQPESDIRRISIYRTPQELEEKYFDLNIPISGLQA